MHPIFKVSAKISPVFRRLRMRKFLQLFNLKPHHRVLDIGGLPQFWDGVPIQAQLTMVNRGTMDDYDRSFMRPNMKYDVGDGTNLSYPDKSFDLVFSNSVIEHLGTAAKQHAFAQECRRVGKAYWIQTPAKEFLIEPHYFTLGVHWFPRHIQKRLLKNFSLWGLLGRPTPQIIDMVLDELRLLTRRQYQGLFPDGQIWVEHVLGWPKSYTAFKPLADTAVIGRQNGSPLAVDGCVPQYFEMDRDRSVPRQKNGSGIGCDNRDLERQD